MKGFLLALLLGAFSFSAQSALIDRGSGLIYDDIQNITWLWDANYAVTNGDDADGEMVWDEAVAWAAGLSYYDTVRNETYSDWRLPTTSQPDPNCSVQFDPGGGFPLQGLGLGCTGSEMGFLYSVTGDEDLYTVFSNVQRVYWTGTEFAPDTDQAWFFHFPFGGIQEHDIKTVRTGAAWAVRDGDVAAIPIPAAFWLFGSALGLLGWMRRKGN